MLIQILTTKLNYPNSIAAYMPLFKWNKHFEKNNFYITFVYNTNYIKHCDILIIDSKYHRNDWISNLDRIFKEFEFFKKICNKLIYFDTTDSTSSIQLELLDIVNKYWKLQIFKDKSNYLNKYFGGRIFTDHLKKVKNYNKFQDQYSKKITNKLLLEKICCSWNSSFGNYGFYGSKINNFLIKTNLRQFTYFNNTYIPPNKVRTNNVSLRFNSRYSRDVIAWQRHNIKLKLSKFSQIKRLSKFQYLNELSRTKLSISPFGWGEIAYKDFESINAGCLLIKPDMSHLKTWPNFYQRNKYYRSFKWDLSNLDFVIQETLENYKDYIQIAINAQNLYKKHTIDRDAKNLFLNRFIELIS